MKTKKDVIPEKTEVQAGTEVAEAQPAKMEFRLINPTEDGFLRVIKWNKEELEAAVRQKIAAYENVVYTEDNIKQAKTDRAELNKLVKAIDERRKAVKKIINEPYEKFEDELKQITALINEPVKLIDKQVKAFEEQQKEEKKKQIEAAYQEVIGDLADVLPFERVFDTRYLNQTFKLLQAQQEIKSKVQTVRTDLEMIDSLESKYKLNAKDVYIKTLDLSKALAENKRLSDLEEKLEAEKRRKAEEEAERKRKAEERRKAAEEKARLAEEQRNVQEAQEKAIQEPVSKQPESVAKQPENVIESQKIGTEQAKNVSNEAGIGTEQAKNVSNEAGNGTQAFVMAAAPFTQQSSEQPKVEEKKYRTRFCAVGTKEQLNGLVEYMKANNIEYGRI
ncbi:MAG: DUF1351 domain-containing protein [Lachnospiraceae bacterium]|nr:DUF1351 domain-containing protein [Lachnospiraceae bacterium]